MAAALRRLLALAFAGLLMSGTLTYGAERKPATPAAKPAAAERPSTLRVPNVRGQAYIFAKGMLEEAGFAWRVQGPVRGFAANTVASQSPAPGARVMDNGAPTVTLRLARSKAYKQRGAPENRSPFPGTVIRPAGAAQSGPGDR